MHRRTPQLPHFYRAGRRAGGRRARPAGANDWLPKLHVAERMTKTLLVTGSSGLIGSEVCQYFANEGGYAIHGVDNNQRAVFFGPQGDTRWNQHRLEADLEGFV